MFAVFEGGGSQEEFTCTGEGWGCSRRCLTAPTHLLLLLDSMYVFLWVLGVFLGAPHLHATYAVCIRPQRIAVGVCARLLLVLQYIYSVQSAMQMCLFACR